MGRCRDTVEMRERKNGEDVSLIDRAEMARGDR